MPVFDSAKGDLPWYALPNTTSTLFGGGTSSMQEEGTLYRTVYAGLNPGGTAGDYVLAVVTLPGGSFDGAYLTDLWGGIATTALTNRGLGIQAQGGFGATANNKRVKIIVGATSAVVGSTIVGGTTIADTGVVATNGAGWSIGADVYKYGLGGSNTQIAIHQQAQVGATVSALLSPQALTLNEAGNIIIAVTGNATTVATDIALNLFVLTGFN